MDLSEDALAAIGVLIDTKLAAAITDLEERVEERVFARLETRFNERFAALESKYDEKCRGLEAANKRLTHEKTELENDLYDTQDRVEDQEQRGRKYNVRIENVPFEGDPRAETDEMLMTKVLATLAELDIIVAPSEIVHMHRTSRPKTLDDGTQVAQAIAKVGYWSTRRKLHVVNRAARDRGKAIRVHHDLTRERLDLLQYARSRVERAMKEKFTKDQLKDLPEADKCFVYASVNCQLLLKINGRDFPFHHIDEFDDLFRDKFSFR